MMDQFTQTNISSRNSPVQDTVPPLKDLSAPQPDIRPKFNSVEILYIWVHPEFKIYNERQIKFYYFLFERIAERNDCAVVELPFYSDPSPEGISRSNCKQVEDRFMEFMLRHQKLRSEAQNAMGSRYSLWDKSGLLEGDEQESIDWLRSTVNVDFRNLDPVPQIAQHLGHYNLVRPRSIRLFRHIVCFGQLPGVCVGNQARTCNLDRLGIRIHHGMQDGIPPGGLED